MAFCKLEILDLLATTMNLFRRPGNLSEKLDETILHWWSLAGIVRLSSFSSYVDTLLLSTCGELGK
jgi:hypothetical protein